MIVITNNRTTLECKERFTKRISTLTSSNNRTTLECKVVYKSP